MSDLKITFFFLLKTPSDAFTHEYKIRLIGIKKKYKIHFTFILSILHDSPIFLLIPVPIHDSTMHHLYLLRLNKLFSVSHTDAADGKTVSGTIFGRF